MTKIMKKLFLLAFTTIIGVGGILGVAYAQDQTNSAESIISFVSNIIVNQDNSVDVTEVITYNTGPVERHGIYRDIYLYSSQDRKMSFENISVTDETGVPYIFQTSAYGKNTRIKIGSPAETFTGQKNYIIKYRATRAVGQLADFDEIYWNVTGNEWNIPIYKTEASVVLPARAPLTQSACYYGNKGSTNKCELVNRDNNIYTFNSPSLLRANEGLTVAVGFAKGVTTPYSAEDEAANFFSKYWSWMVAGILPILSLLFSLLYWYKKGRDARGAGVIVPQYDVPDNLSPMEVAAIANENLSDDNVSAEIIYLATKGYLKINQLEERFIKFIKSVDYELVKLKDSADLPNEFDRKLLDGLFTAKPKFKSLDLLKGGFSRQKLMAMALEPEVSVQTIKLSELANSFFGKAHLVVVAVLDSLLNKGYYKNLGRMKNGLGSRIFILAFMSVWASGFFGAILGMLIFRADNPFPFMVGIFFSIIIYGIISHFSPAKTEKGTLAKEYILGLKDYLQIAEKDRLQFHNAPEKSPEVFEKLLPYALALGVVDIWAKEFEGIYKAPPEWYSGPTGNNFSAIAFGHSMSSFSSATSSLSSSSGGGGSGGGGSSGGGGGGGGGGGW
ncbi:MAG: hypothetical protein A2571_01965 [Candidatus Vogelbacteria bacterium RIFOXYD1_FULL_44_32]|uniref:DUF2207 domain-containing protein n=1 Tax=Candidatus Vogelbacteria bacterium RIFOXYD1_FULL_44_32 TaxID=1802438 RepID=A0A1G2QD69_9BACT|nr:MAG: hypothetical protein A2571_01965 [Candidatus Vogelbacteria bacterium RIFOXYD1_FULL_44_32]